MAKKEIVCCISCGRDTIAKSGFCFRCVGGNSRTFAAQINETKDRKQICQASDNDSDMICQINEMNS